MEPIEENAENWKWKYPVYSIAVSEKKVNN
jgi:hypothetical protein